MFKSKIWPKLAPHGRERAFCALFIEITLFSRFGDDLRPVRGFEIWCAQKWDFAKLAPHGPKRAFCAYFIELAPLS